MSEELETTEGDACHLSADEVHALVAPSSDDLRAVLRDLLATIELHTDCMDGYVDRSALDRYIERAETLLGESIFELSYRGASDAPQGECPGYLRALGDVAAERLRQRTEEGCSPGHDDGHTNGELAAAGMCYAGHACLTIQGLAQDTVPTPWPWADEHWNPKNPRRDLVRAAALIIAEIERLDRAEAKKG